MPKPVDFDLLRDGFIADLRRNNPTAKTHVTYRIAVDEFGDWLGTLPDDALTVHRSDERRPLVVVPGAVYETGDITADHLRCFVTYLQTRDQHGGGRGRSVVRSGKLAPATVSNRYRAIQSFVKWLWVQGEFGSGPDSPGPNPMATLKPPKVPKNEPRAMTLDEAKALVATCGTGRKRDFIDIRDEAILRLFFEAGPRREEVASALLAWLSMTRKQLLLPGEITKTDTGRAVPFGDRTALAVNRYLVVRERHKHAGRPELWLSTRGAFTPGGVYQMVRRRGDMIGIKRLHPHMFRHTFANLFLDGGGTEDELKRIGGWESDSMVRHYSQARANQRALNAHAALALGDQL